MRAFVSIAVFVLAGCVQSHQRPGFAEGRTAGSPTPVPGSSPRRRPEEAAARRV